MYERIEQSTSLKGYTLGLILLLTTAVLLRIWAASGDFWLDEIWSLNFAKSASSPVDIVTKMHHDNNHILNTLNLYLLGDQENWFNYRLFSIVTGIGLVALLGYISFQRGPLESVTTVLLAALSYPLILYSSEARGYTPSAFFSLLSYALIRSYWERKHIAKLILFWITVALGFLSHLSFIYVYFAIIVWSLYRVMMREKDVYRLCIELIKYHAFPVMILSVLYRIHIRHIVIGGGEVYDVWNVVYKAIIMSVGAPEKGIFGLIGIGSAVAVFFLGLRLLWQEKTGEWIFFLFVIFLAPALIILIRKPEIIYFRYFFVCIPFFYLLAGHLLSWCFRQVSYGQLVYGAALLLYCSGNIYRDVTLLDKGRGQYYDAMQFMAANSSGTDIIVGSDHDFRNKTVMSFYSRYLPPGKKLRYVDQNQWPAEGLEWLVTHNQEVDYQPLPHLTMANGITYSLANSFRYSGVSGWHWFVYRKDNYQKNNKR